MSAGSSVLVAVSCLVIGVWLLVIDWCLEFGVWLFRSPLHDSSPHGSRETENRHIERQDEEEDEAADDDDHDRLNERVDRGQGRIHPALIEIGHLLQEAAQAPRLLAG